MQAFHAAKDWLTFLLHYTLNTHATNLSQNERDVIFHGHSGSIFADVSLAASLLLFVQCPWKSCGLNVCVATNTGQLVQGAGSMLISSVGIPMQIVIVVEYMDAAHQQLNSKTCCKNSFSVRNFG